MSGTLRLIGSVAFLVARDDSAVTTLVKSRFALPIEITVRWGSSNSIVGGLQESLSVGSVGRSLDCAMEIWAVVQEFVQE